MLMLTPDGHKHPHMYAMLGRVTVATAARIRSCNRRIFALTAPAVATGSSGCESLRLSARCRCFAARSFAPFVRRMSQFAGDPPLAHAADESGRGWWSGFDGQQIECGLEAPADLRVVLA